MPAEPSGGVWSGFQMFGLQRFDPGGARKLTLGAIQIGTLA